MDDTASLSFDRCGSRRTPCHTRASCPSGPHSVRGCRRVLMHGTIEGIVVCLSVLTFAMVLTPSLSLALARLPLQFTKRSWLCAQSCCNRHGSTVGMLPSLRSDGGSTVAFAPVRIPGVA